MSEIIKNIFQIKLIQKLKNQLIMIVGIKNRERDILVKTIQSITTKSSKLNFIKLMPYKNILNNLN